MSGPRRSQPQARHSQHYKKTDKRWRIRCLSPPVTTPIRDNRERTSTRTLQLLFQHIKSAEHRHHIIGNDKICLIQSLTSCNTETNCTKGSNPRTTAPPCTYEPTIVTHNANTISKPMAHHIFSANAKRNRRKNTSKQTQPSHPINTAHTTFLVLLNTTRSVSNLQHSYNF
jgi:hypothetical protein